MWTSSNRLSFFPPVQVQFCKCGSHLLFEKSAFRKKMVQIDRFLAIYWCYAVWSVMGSYRCKFGAIFQKVTSNQGFTSLHICHILHPPLLQEGARSLTEIHVFVLAHVIRRPIIVYCARVSRFPPPHPDALDLEAS